MLVGRDREIAVLDSHFDAMLAGRGSVLFLTGEAGLGKTTLVHSWWRKRRAEGGGMRDEESIDGNASSSLIPHPSSLLLESACSIPIGNVDVGHLEALQPWADVVAQLHEKIDQADRSDQSDQSDQPHRSNARKLDFKKLIHDAAPAWAWAIPFVGDIAHAALETSRSRSSYPHEKLQLSRISRTTAWVLCSLRKVSKT